jgi:hypothetical protein
MALYSNAQNQIVGAWHTEVIDGKGNRNIIRVEYGTNGKYYFSESVINADDDIVHIGTYTIIGNKLRRVLNGVTEEVSYKIVDGMLHEVNGGKEQVFKRQTEQDAALKNQQ